MLCWDILHYTFHGLLQIPTNHIWTFGQPNIMPQGIQPHLRGIIIWELSYRGNNNKCNSLEVIIWSISILICGFIRKHEHQFTCSLIGLWAKKYMSALIAQLLILYTTFRFKTINAIFFLSQSLNANSFDISMSPLIGLSGRENYHNPKTSANWLTEINCKHRLWDDIQPRVHEARGLQAQAYKILNICILRGSKHNIAIWLKIRSKQGKSIF